MAMALSYVCYMHCRMATTATRGGITPYEIIKEQRPSIRHCYPFGTKAYVLVPKENRVKMSKKGLGHIRAEIGRIVGFDSMWGTTPLVMLPPNRLVRRRDVTYDTKDFSWNSNQKEAAPASQEPDPATELLKQMLHETSSYQQPAPGDTIPEGATPEGVTPAASPEVPEPRTTSPIMDDVIVEIDDDFTVADNGRVRKQVQPFIPHHHGMEGEPQKLDTYNKDPRQTFYMNIEQLMKIEQEHDIFAARLAKASQQLNRAATAGGDIEAHQKLAINLAVEAQKDMSWKAVLRGPDKDKASEALDKELTSLQNTILTEILQGDPQWETAVKNATQGRILLDIKRNGTYKARGVKRGFLENKAIADGYDFDYYSNVVKLHAVRTALFSRRDNGSRTIKIKDVSTAFLQSKPYPNGKLKFIWFRHPITGRRHYYAQSGPIYGEAAAPVYWEDTIAPWIVEQGFIRGKNEPGVFWHPKRQVALLLYVDDLFADGNEEDVDWIFNLLEHRFQCKEAETLLPGQFVDYLGLNIGRDNDGNVCLSMQTYIERACEVLEVQPQQRAVATPITTAIDPESGPITPKEFKKFLTGLGMLGWLAQTGRPDVAYCYSRIGQHSANPSSSALQAVLRAFQYLLQHKTLSLSAPFGMPDRDLSSETGPWSVSPEGVHEWMGDPQQGFRFYTDSDHAGNTEIQNRRRSQNGMIIVYNGAPVYWQSKASSVTFACEDIGEGHADMSSAAVEIYAAGNATLDILGYSYVVEELGLPFEKPFYLEIDNEAARIWIRGSGGRTKLKHIDCRQEWVLTLRDKKLLVPVHIDTALNRADLFTKILPPKVFIIHRDELMKPCVMDN